LAATNGATIYLDINGNGQPDAGESAVTSVALGAGDTAQLIVAYDVPVNAANGTTAEVTLVATSSDTNAIVKDIGTNGDAAALINPDIDDDNATNQDVVEITTGPVLVLNKQAVFDAATNKVTYTLTVKNTGGSDAKLVDIIDGIPMVDHDGNSSTAKQPLTNVTIISTNGLLDTGDVTAAITAADETIVGYDLNDDGDALDTAVTVVKATDKVLAPNTTVSIV